MENITTKQRILLNIAVGAVCMGFLFMPEPWKPLATMIIFLFMVIAPITFEFVKKKQLKALIGIQKCVLCQDVNDCCIAQKFGDRILWVCLNDSECFERQRLNGRTN